ncbi:MAG: hypothetical protein HRT35_21360 [Algicola sp.]|nr:hypothetical protein [Algicola sp.]
MTGDTGILTIGEHAQWFLRLQKKDRLPKVIHDALQNIFTKGNNKAESIAFRKAVITSKEGAHNSKHLVNDGSEHAIYNALCLIYLIGTRETKKLFQQYYETIRSPDKRDFSILNRETQQRYLAYFSLGIMNVNVENIRQALESDDFDLFKDKLPSPFSTESFDLTPMLTVYGQDIPWQDYLTKYQQAETCYEHKKYEQASQLLDELAQTTVLRLPVIDALRRKIKAEENEAEDAWDFFQQLIT